MISNKLHHEMSIFLLIFVFFVSSCSKNEIGKPNFIPKIKNPISLQDKEVVIKTYFEEIIEKDEISRIDLIAKKEKEPFYDELVLLIDGTRYPLGQEMKGYHPELILTDLDNDGLADIKITVRSGDTDDSLFFELYHFRQRSLESLVPKNIEKVIVPLQLSWFSEISIQITSQAYKLNLKKRVSLPNRLVLFARLGISGYQIFDSIDIDHDGQSELITEQSIWVQYPFQSIFHFQTVLKYSNNFWSLIEYRFIPVKYDSVSTLPKQKN
jgi:hypothetical protein